MSVAPMNQAEVCVGQEAGTGGGILARPLRRRYSKEYVDGMSMLVEEVGTTALQHPVFEGSAKKELQAYLWKWNPHVALDEASCLIEKGKTLLADILSGKTTDPRQVPGGSAYALNLVAWCLMSCALAKNQAHREGSFAIEDPNGMLYQFFYKAEGAGYRMSSHYPTRRLEKDVVSQTFRSQLGVNVRTGKMPGNLPHVLFGQVKASPPHQEPLFFMKLESHSPFVLSGPQPLPNLAPRLEVPLGDWTRHAVSFACSGWTKVFSPANNDGSEMAKEHPPVSVLKAFEAICTALPKTVFEEVVAVMVGQGFCPDPVSNSQQYGISYMSRFVDEVKSRVRSPQAQAAQAGQVGMLLESPESSGSSELPGLAESSASPGSTESTESEFMTAFEASLVGLDHLHKRTGREVYITLEEMLAHIQPGT